VAEAAGVAAVGALPHPASARCQRGAWDRLDLLGGCHAEIEGLGLVARAQEDEGGPAGDDAFEGWHPGLLGHARGQRNGCHRELELAYLGAEGAGAGVDRREGFAG